MVISISHRYWLVPSDQIARRQRLCSTLNFDPSTLGIQLFRQTELFKCQFNISMQ